MVELFMRVLQMSLVASWCIVLVFVLRFFLKRISYTYAYLLWGIVLFRLACPVMWEAPFGLLPSQESSFYFLSETEDVADAQEELQSPDSTDEGADNSLIGSDALSKQENFAGFDILEEESSLKGSDILKEQARLKDSDVLKGQAPLKGSNNLNASAKGWKIGSIIWLAGIFLFWGSALFSYLRFRKGLMNAEPCLAELNKEEKTKNTAGKIFVSAYIDTPFVMGIFRPQIYLPEHLEKKEQEYILLHEQFHIRRGDYLVKLLGFLLLGIHWFNPLVYGALYFMEQDMEMSCDEKVLQKLGAQIKREYSASLLKLSAGKRISVGIPLAFGEGNPKRRIRHVLSYKKPSFWLGIGALAAALFVGGGLLLRPARASIEPAFHIEQLKADAGEKEWFYVKCLEEGENTQISSEELGTWLENTEFRVKDVASPYELIYSYEICGLGEEEQPVSLRLYETEQELVMVYNEAGWQYYSIRQKDYEEFVKLLQSRSSSEPDIDFGEGEDSSQAGEILDALFEKLMAAAPASSNPSDYVKAEPEAFEEILGYQYSTLAYCFTAFEEGSQTGLKGALMAQACAKITGSSLQDYENGQQWYDARKAHAKQMEAEQGWDEAVKSNFLEGAILQFLAGDMEGYTEEIFLPDYVYEGEDELEKLVYETVMEAAPVGYREGFQVWAIRIHGSYEEGTQRKVIATVYEAGYHLYGDRLRNVSGSVVPMAFTYERLPQGEGAEAYRLISSEMAGDGSYFIPSIEAFCTMPVSGTPIEGLAEEIMRVYGKDTELEQMMEQHVQEHLEKYGE